MLPSSPVKLLRRSARLAATALRTCTAEAGSSALAAPEPAAASSRPQPAPAPQRQGRRAAGREAGAGEKPRAAPGAPAARQEGPTRALEEELWGRGYKRVVGVDEAGRGPLAGPVVAAACCIPQGVPLGPDLAALNDSKKLSEKRREALYELLVRHPSIACAVAVVHAHEIDAEESNILKAALAAMEHAVAGLPGDLPDYVLVDGTHKPPGLREDCVSAVVRGDGTSTVIAAASILAKVTRDRLMTDLHRTWPQYGFDRHKGYGTAAHMKALRDFGPCPLHRRSFEPLKGWLASGVLPAEAAPEPEEGEAAEAPAPAKPPPLPASVFLRVASGVSYEELRERRDAAEAGS